MSTFQSVFFAILHSIAQFLPLSTQAHNSLASFLLQWPAPPPALLCALSLGSLLAVLLYFRHDWLSMLSGFLHVVAYRKKPMTVDERMPFFVAIATVPAAIAWYYGSEPVAQHEWTIPLICGILAGFGILLVAGENFSRRSKSMVDWNWADALIAGVGGSLFLIPGAGHLGGVLLFALLRNYNREAAAKFALLLAMPFCLAESIHLLRGMDFSAAMPDTDFTWLSFGTAAVVSTVAGLLVIGGFLKSTQRNGYVGIATYRAIVAIGAGAMFWFRNR